MNGYIYGNKITFDGNSGVNKHNYVANTERVVGTFLDRPLYQYVVYIQGVDLVNEIPSVLYDNDVETVIDAQMILTSNDGSNYSYIAPSGTIRNRNGEWTVTRPTTYDLTHAILYYVKWVEDSDEGEE